MSVNNDFNTLQASHSPQHYYNALPVYTQKLQQKLNRDQLQVRQLFTQSNVFYIVLITHNFSSFQGRSQDFSKGGGGVTLCQTLSSWRFRHGIL